MKYIFTDVNMKSVSEERDIQKFSSSKERNEWVTNNLFNNDDTIDERMSLVKNRNKQILNLVNSRIQVPYKESELNKNYVIVKDSIYSDYLFYIVRGRTIAENANMVELELELDPFMTYYNVIDSLKDFNLIEGHIPFKNYFNYEFVGGDRYIEEVSPLKRNYENNYGGEESSYTVLVYRGLQIDRDYNFLSGLSRLPQEGVLVNGVKHPYKVFIAENVVKTVNDQVGKTRDISLNNLLRYYNECLSDGLTLKIQIIPKTFLRWSGSSWIANEGTKVVNFKAEYVWENNVLLADEKETFDLLELKEVTLNESDFKNNSYTIEKPLVIGGNDFKYLRGIEDYGLEVPGEVLIDWPFNVLSVESLERLEISLNSYIGVDGNVNWIEWAGYPFKPTDGNSWSNSTTLAVYTNQYNEYMASDPSNKRANAENGILGAIGAGIKGGAVGAAGGTVVFPGIGSLAGGVIGASVGAGKSLVGHRFSRKQEMRKLKLAPLSYSGEDGNTYFKMTKIDHSFRLVMNKYKYNENIRNSVINDLYRSGLVVEGSYFVDNFESIKRPVFNFMSITGFDNHNTSLDLSEEVIELLRYNFENGVRVWHKNYMEYSDTFEGNGDTVDYE